MSETVSRVEGGLMLAKGESRSSKSCGVFVGAMASIWRVIGDAFPGRREMGSQSRRVLQKWSCGRVVCQRNLSAHQKENVRVK